MEKKVSIKKELYHGMCSEIGIITYDELKRVLGKEVAEKFLKKEIEDFKNLSLKNSQKGEYFDFCGGKEFVRTIFPVKPFGMQISTKTEKVFGYLFGKNQHELAENYWKRNIELLSTQEKTILK